MRLRVIVFTTTTDPDTVRLDDCWDLETAELEDAVVRQALADRLTELDTKHAAIVDVALPDALLRQLLDPREQLVPGIVADRPNPRPGA